MSTLYFEKLSELLKSNVPFVSVIVVDTGGSVPQDPGTKMLVTKEGLHFGTVGGGKIEKKAIDEALELLKCPPSPTTTTRFVNWSLSKDIGMTCGGHVKLFFETYNSKTWNIVIFGAGHVANSLVKILCDLECRLTCIDPRQDWLDKLPSSPKLRKILAADMNAEVDHLAEDSFVLLITMGHTTDSPILTKILKTERQFPYLGVIGSKAKAAVLRSDIRRAGLPAEAEEKFYCPIGLDIGTNHLQEIAISISAQLISIRDKHQESRQEKSLDDPQ